MSRTAQRQPPPPTCPEMDLKPTNFHSKRKYPTHRNTLYWIAPGRTCTLNASTGVLIDEKRALVCGFGDVNKVCSMNHPSFVMSYPSTNQVLAQLDLLKNWTRSFSSPTRVMISPPQGSVLKTPGGGGEGMMSTNYPTHLGGAHKRSIRPPSLPSQTLQTATLPTSPLPRPLMRVCVCLSVPSLPPNPRNHNFA